MTTKKAGPALDRVKINMDWEDVMEKALETKHPKEGWPETKNKEESEIEGYLLAQYLRYRPF